MMDWNIQARAQTCHVCGRPFVDGEVYHTALFDEKSVYLRQDLCTGCWSGRSDGDGGRGTGWVSQWQGVFEAPKPQPELIRKETAETLLRKLIERGDPEHTAAVFILGVMLERKRLLKVKDQIRQEGRRHIVYEHVKSGDVFTIEDPALSLDQLDGVQRDVASLLEHGAPDDLESSPTGSMTGLSTEPQDPDAGPTEGPHRREAESTLRGDCRPG
jgi:hypothetical protein